MSQHVKINFGPLSPRIEEQLKDQGLKLDLEPLQRVYLQRDVDAVGRLSCRGILTPAESGKVRRRILKIIQKQAKPL